jgi:pSer/pThr/pTyr-binding forkhead associated (FHA) protein
VPALPPEPARAKFAEPPFHAPSKGNPSAWLVCIEGQSAGRAFPIEDAQYWIGASPNNHLQLGDDQTVSGNHACIAFEHDGLDIYDHKSTNGIYLNDQRLTDGKRVLQPGDRLRIGRSTFVLQPSSAQSAT